MAVTSCVYARDAGEADFNDRNLGTYQVAWDITTDALMGPLAVANGALLVGANPLPALWSPYVFGTDADSSSFLRNVKLKRNPNKETRWRASGTYTPYSPGEEPGVENTDPLSRPPKWSGGLEVYTRLITKDKDGEPLVNFVNREYDPAIEREDVRPVASAIYNYATLSAAMSVARAMAGAVNDGAWRGQSERSVLCSPEPMPPQTEGSTTYYPVRFDFTLAEEGETWDDSILEQGMSYFATANTPASRVNVTGAEPVLLAADGTKLADGLTGLFTDHRTRREVDFASELGF